MENTVQNQSVIITTGMHRSGTSLTASLLQSAGLNIGDRLMGASTGNDKGHFEDLDFVEFHQNVLQSQGISIAGWTKENKIPVQEQYLGAAQALIKTKQEYPIWGWKDPRTSLFLDFWSELIPHAKFIFIYRSPWEVVDSLFRRGDVIFQTNPNFAVEQWVIYNQAILNFKEIYPEKCLLFDLKSITNNPDLIINKINEKFELNLRSPEQLYEESLLTVKTNNSYREALIKQYFPQAIDLYLELHQQADLIEQPQSSTVDHQGAGLICESWILQDWNDLQRETKAKKHAQRELQQIEEKLAQSQEQLTQTQQQLKETEAKLTQTKQQSEKTENKLTQTKQRSEKTENKLTQTKRQLQIYEKQKEQLELLVVAMETSKFWQLRTGWIKFKKNFNINRGDELYELYQDSIIDSFISKDSQTNHPLPRIKDKGWEHFLLKLSKDKLPKLKQALLHPEPKVTQLNSEIPYSQDSKYQNWLNKNYPMQANLNNMAENVAKFQYQPKFSVIVPVYNVAERFLREAIESVQQQVYPDWELCLADDFSTQPHVRQVLEEYAQQDQRIKVVFREVNGHISHASNSALELATGEFIALLDHDDLLAPHALYEVVKLLQDYSEADMIYSDEDKIDDHNFHRDPFFKTDWCPDSFLSRMYTCHLGVYRRSLVTEIGNFRVGFEGSQDYDLVLRLTEKTDKIFHIPNILYHWRIHALSAAADGNAKPYAINAAQKALSEAITRRKEPGEVILKPKFPGVYTIRYQVKEHKLVSIIIPTKDLADTLDVCLKSIFALTTYPNYEVIVIDNSSIEPQTFQCFKYWQQQEPQRFKHYSYDVPFNYSQINNYAVTKADGDYLLFLNNDTEVINEDWIEAMVEQAQRPSIGAVGSLLLYPDKTIQHAGVILGIGSVAGHSHKLLPVIMPGYISQAISTNNYSAVTGACLMCRREVFTEIGGFEEELAVAFNDIDLCLKIISRGYRNIYLPHVVLYHYESKSRGHENTPAKQARFAGEVNYMKQKWQSLIDNDPCYSPHLTKTREDYSIAMS
jgi:O-antigen biosynthesis protein